MTRFTNSENQAGAEASHVLMATMVHLDFASGQLYLWNGIGAIEWNGVTWVGTGEFGSIEVIEESQDDRPKALRLALSGIDSAVMTEALAANYYGRSCRIYTGFFSEDVVLLADPELEYEGRMDSMKIDHTEESASVELTVESRTILWSQSNGALYTDEAHQSEFPGDLFFDQQCLQADQYLEWGKHTPGQTGSPGSGVGRRYRP